MSIRNVTELLRGISFGHRIAEDEIDQLSSYFVETDQWRRIYAGEIDIVYGPKGSGKSAIYFLLLGKSDELKSRRIFIIAGENPRGAPAFKDLVDDPPASEAEFRGLWKLYFLTLVAHEMRECEVKSDEAREVVAALEEAGLLDPGESPRLSRLIKSVLELVRRLSHPESLEASVTIDPVTGVPLATGRITLAEPSAEQHKAGIRSADELFLLANSACEAEGVNCWVVLDRLDVAFAETPELEQNALRALFRVYIDLMGLGSIGIKIFLRDDIWQRMISDQGFREASHITKTVTMTWDEPSLLNLIVRRALRHQQIRDAYGVTENSVLASREEQRACFYRMFPDQVDPGSRRPTTFDWILSRTRDGTGQTAPRELIHLLESARSTQLKKIELGEDAPSDDKLFTQSAIKEALAEVSKVRLEQTIFAESPMLKSPIQQLDQQKTEQNVHSLAKIWGVRESEARETASALVDVGFFENRGSFSEPTYWVPFLYRETLHMIQGTAD